MPDRRRRVGLQHSLTGGVILCVAVASLGRATLAQGVADSGSNSGSGAVAGGAGAASPGSGGPTVGTPSLLPATGFGGGGSPDVRLGNLGANSIAAGSVPLAAATRAWTVTPSLGVSEEYSSGGTGGGGQGGGNGRGEFITTVSPSVAISGDTVRLHGELAYAPQIELYAPDGNQNQVGQNFNGRLLATVLPQTLFLDLRGSGAVQSTSTGQGPTATTNLSRDNTTQNYSFSASPYAVHRFGPWGTGEVGGSVARTIQSSLKQNGTVQSNFGQTGFNQAGFNQNGQFQNGFFQNGQGINSAATNQNVTSYSGHLAFVTGEAFSRYSGTALAQATSYDGSGVLFGAYRDTATLDSGYGITRTITALATVGYERIHYAGTAPVHISDAVWSAGVRLEPNAASSITVRYGHHDGLDSASLDASFQPTARIHVYARYSTGLTTQAEQLQNALATSDLDTQGNPVDHLTGAPLVPVGNFFGTDNNLSKTTVASLTGVLQLDRDSFTASVNSQTQTLISGSSAAGLAASAAAGGTNGGNSSGVYGSLSWSHELRPDLQSTLFVQYGTSSTSQSGVPGAPAQGNNPDQRSLSASASLSYALSRTLSGQFQYSYNQTSGGSQFGAGTRASANGSSTQNIVLLSLLKSF